MRSPDETIWLLLAVAAGTVIPVQAGINAALSRRIGHPVEAALVSFCVGGIALFAYCVLLQLPRPSLAALSRVPFLLWTGGLFGAFLVASTTYLAPRLGPSVMVGFIIASQLLTSLVLEQFGLLGFHTRPISLGRVVGALLLLAGMMLLRRF